MALPAGMGLSAAAAAAGYSYQRSNSPEESPPEDPEDMLLGGLAALSEPGGAAPQSAVVLRPGYPHPPILPHVMGQGVVAPSQRTLPTQPNVATATTSPSTAAVAAAAAAAAAGAAAGVPIPVQPRPPVLPQARR